MYMAKLKAKTQIEDVEDTRIETPKIESTDQVYDLIFKEDDVTWRTIIIDLAKSGKIDPWDVEISTLAQEYLKIVSKLKETNFRLSGKVISAAALLLRLKADRMGYKEFLQLTHPEEFQEQLDEGDLFDFEITDETLYGLYKKLNKRIGLREYKLYLIFCAVMLLNLRKQLLNLQI